MVKGNWRLRDLSGIRSLNGCWRTDACEIAPRGASGEARRIAAELERGQQEHYVLPYNIAKLYAALGEKDLAFTWLERAHQEGNPDLIELNTEPLLDGLRSEPRFTELMRRIGFSVPAAAGTSR
jgi:hypothetical protein